MKFHAKAQRKQSAQRKTKSFALCVIGIYSFNNFSRKIRDCWRLEAISCPFFKAIKYVPPGIGLTREICARLAIAPREILLDHFKAGMKRERPLAHPGEPAGHQHPRVGHRGGRRRARHARRDRPDRRRLRLERHDPRGVVARRVRLVAHQPPPALRDFPFHTGKIAQSRI